jgi:pyrophosphate--fructose-6-phosphate 1-phosphotransferase
MNCRSPLQRHRANYQPQLPLVLQKICHVACKKEAHAPLALDPAIQSLFSMMHKQPVLTFHQSEKPNTIQALKVGIVLSGGQAPGGHNVISGLLDALKKLHSHSTLIGFLDGPAGIIKNQTMVLTEENVAPYRNQGGFDLIGSGRTKIETPEQFLAVKQTLLSHQLDGLVIVGGDDSNTNAVFLAEFCAKEGLPTKIIGVPKTIDGDLKNTYIEISFGFDSASKIYSEVIGNLAKDALSSKKYYFFIKMMGRSSSHLTLECALYTQINLALIGEEILHAKKKLPAIVSEIADLVCERAKLNKHFGVILIPEGLLEFIPECQEMIQSLNRLFDINHEIGQTLAAEIDGRKSLAVIQKELHSTAAQTFFSLPEEIQVQLVLDRDSHGNVQLSKIETERLLITLVENELLKRKQKQLYEGFFNAQPLFCGYEGRSGLPSNFDSQYCYTLGHGAAILISQGASGYIVCVKNLAQSIEKWEMRGVPIVQLLHFEERKNKKQAVIEKALVDLKGDIFNFFKEKREQWRLEDLYCSPGPIQFEGPKETTEQAPFSLRFQIS